MWEPESALIIRIAAEIISGVGLCESKKKDADSTRRAFNGSQGKGNVLGGGAGIPLRQDRLVESHDNEPSVNRMITGRPAQRGGDNDYVYKN